MRVIIDGEAVDPTAAVVSVFDWVVIRGMGVFEVVRSYGGTLFRMGQHLERLERSAASLGLSAPPRHALERDLAAVAAAGGDGQVRVVITGGGRDAEVAAPSRTVVMWEPIPSGPERIRVLPVVAPWHPATDQSGFPGVKWTSYAPNMATTDIVRRSGFDEALLMTPDQIVLEGPTFSYAWVVDGRIETPSLDLGILASITREVLIECATAMGIAVVEGRFHLDRMLAADEVLALSTLKEVVPVEAIGSQQMAVGPVVPRLAAALVALVAEEVGGSSREG